MKTIKQISPLKKTYFRYDDENFEIIELGSFGVNYLRLRKIKAGEIDGKD